MVVLFCLIRDLNERPQSPEGTAAERRGGNVDFARGPQGPLPASAGSSLVFRSTSKGSRKVAFLR